MVNAPEEFEGTERFAVRRRLGAGGMGVVYHAYDRQAGSEVALKTLKHLDPASLYHFKREFRALADVAHPNLIKLFELISERNLWFFTMELITGSNFYEYVCTPDNLQGALSTFDFKDHSSFARVFASEPEMDELSELGDLEDPTEILTTMQRPEGPLPRDDSHSTLVESRPPRDGPPAPNMERLRSALQQLTQGLQALHGQGKLHRDLKPSNVLVTRSGRLVVLDFGLVADIEGQGSQFLTSTHAGIAGTFAYMAPEQGKNEALTTAADWYAVGVMLYEALTGQLPFPETGLEALIRKQREEPPPPAAIMGGVPPELSKLCVDLLRIDPERRPKGEEVWDRLASPSASTSVGIRVPAELRRESTPFMGRSKHLAALEAGYAASQRDPVAMFVRGGSGMGKSVLVRRFLEAVNERGDAVILSGRCYERESVPYKALDSLIDSLSRYLAKIPKHKAAALLPRGIAALARVFPVLARVPVVAEAHRLPALTSDETELRRRAFSALRELLARISDETKIVMFIDDLQWGDLDSAQMLRELLRPPEAPPVMLIGCYRSEDESRSPVIQELGRLREFSANYRTLTVGALGHEEAADLAVTLLDLANEDVWPIAQQIASESGGNPFFIDAMARHVREQKSSGRPYELRLERVIQARVEELPERVAKMLQILAVAGRPVRADIAFAAAGVPKVDEPAVLDRLRTGRFTHTIQSSSNQNAPRLIECVHDRVRTAVLSMIPGAELPTRHGQLAEAYREMAPEEVEAIFQHAYESGDRETAADYAQRAAEAARGALAFGQAAALWRLAIELRPHSPRDVQSHNQAQLGDALSYAGRGPEAAEAYAAAAESLNGLDRLDLHRKAGLQLLIGGQYDEGLKVLRKVLEALDVRIPRTLTGAAATQALTMAKLWSQGLQFESHPESELSRKDLLRVDALYSAASGLSSIDPVLGGEIQARHLLAALKLGEPYRAARAVAISALHAGSGGSKELERSETLRQELRKLTEKSSDPRLIGYQHMADGIVEYLNGAFAPARRLLEEAERSFRATPLESNWELATVRWLLNVAIFFVGDLKALAHRVPRLLDDADLRGAWTESALLRMGYSNTVFLMRDNPERTLRVIDETVRRWSQKGFFLQHYLARSSLSQTYLYMGEGEKALHLLDETWPALRDSKLMSSQYLRIDAGFLRSRVLIAAALQGPPAEAPARLAEALRFNEKIAGEDTAWVRPMVELVKGLVVAFRSPKEAIEPLERAIAGFEACNMKLHAYCARYRLGGFLRGDEGLALQRDAATYFSSEGVRNPRRFISVFTPTRE